MKKRLTLGFHHRLQRGLWCTFLLIGCNDGTADRGDAPALDVPGDVRREGGDADRIDAPPAHECPAGTTFLARPFDVDSNEYPFVSCAFDTGHGRMHFFDEGPRNAEETIVMVHGNPTWSYLYRHLARAMIARGHRVVAMDHLGMGMSEVATADFDYRPRSHSANLEALVDALGLDHITLVVQDWGGPIGLGVATRRPEIISRILVMNTWAWSIDSSAPGRDHSLARWGALASMLGTRDPDFGCNTMLTLTADAIASEVDPDRGPAFERARAAYLQPAMDPLTRRPLSSEDCRAMSTLALSILGDDAFQAEVEAALPRLRGIPYSALSGLRDDLFGALHCDATATELCPASAECVCDSRFDATGRDCAATPLGDARVCVMEAEPIEQNLDQWVERLGTPDLVARVAVPSAAHMIQEFAPDQVRQTLETLLAAPAP